MSVVAEILRVVSIPVSRICRYVRAHPECGVTNFLTTGLQKCRFQLERFLQSLIGSVLRPFVATDDFYLQERCIVTTIMMLESVVLAYGSDFGVTDCILSWTNGLLRDVSVLLQDWKSHRYLPYRMVASGAEPTPPEDGHDCWTHRCCITLGPTVSTMDAALEKQLCYLRIIFLMPRAVLLLTSTKQQIPVAALQDIFQNFLLVMSVQPVFVPLAHRQPAVSPLWIAVWQGTSALWWGVLSRWAVVMTALHRASQACDEALEPSRSNLSLPPLCRAFFEPGGRVSIVSRFNSGFGASHGWHFRCSFLLHTSVFTRAERLCHRRTACHLL